MTLTNNGSVPCEIELTSYGEIALAPPDADRAHPAFGSLFVETAWHAWCSAVTGTRRPRAPSEHRVWCTHVVATGEERVGEITCETDRSRFLGRGASTARSGGRSTMGRAALEHGRGDRSRSSRSAAASGCEPGRSASVGLHHPGHTTASEPSSWRIAIAIPARRTARWNLAWTAAQDRAARAGHLVGGRGALAAGGRALLLRSPAPRAGGASSPRTRVPAHCSGQSASRGLADSPGHRRFGGGAPTWRSFSPRTSTGAGAG